MIGRHIALLTGMLALLLSTELRAQIDVGYTQTGIASYYGRKFHGKKTSSGEIFNMWDLTAAHKTIPLNAKVRVTNLINNKSVVVRINDHGPHARGRIIDLSRAAAAQIDMIERGTARVRLDVISLDARPDFEKERGNIEFFAVDIERADLAGFAVQIASFEHLGNLVQQLDRLKTAGIDNAYVQMATVSGKLVHRLVVGDYKTEEAARWKLRTLREKGFDGFVMRIP
ncbi:MAG: septal ring lytic transglycosylase RlpA family protein [Bacteroidota bacterium]|jgi:rare lipoprotein A|nr:septal ring lytic transglycosylase RlpA family protein [Bacteroidota bacterium]